MIVHTDTSCTNMYKVTTLDPSNPIEFTISSILELDDSVISRMNAMDEGFYSFRPHDVAQLVGHNIIHKTYGCRNTGSMVVVYVQLP